MLTPLTTDAGRIDGLRRGLRLLSYPYVLLVLVAFTVWLPQGFNIGAVNDGWIHIGSSLINGDPTRMFGKLPMRLGFFLSPGNFVGMQLAILAMMVLHAVFFYEIVRRLLPGRELIALAAGLIGLFHGADRSYFWVGAMGLQFGLTTALGSAFCAILYLDDGRRRYLAATLALQALSMLTYPGFLPLIVGIPFGAWLLRRIAGTTTPFSYLFKVNALLVAALCLYGYLIHTEAGRNARVADPHLHAVFQGYAWAVGRLIYTVPEQFQGLSLLYMLMALSVAVLAFPAALRAASGDQLPRTNAAAGWRYLGMAVAGLLLLALLSYLPYAVTKVRFATARTVLACGMFAFTALAVLVLAWLQPRLHKTWTALLVALLAGYTALAGLHGRDSWVRAYRAEEALLAAVAAAVPHPIPGTVFLVHLHRRAQGSYIGGFYKRQLAFSLALEHMYGDSTLEGGFYGFGGDQVRLGAGGVHMRGYHHTEGAMRRYPSLIVLDYPPGASKARLLDSSWLQQQAGPNAAAAAGYAPRFGKQPAPGAIMCSMLETGFRPSYCR